MQDTAVLNSPAEQVEHVERVFWIKVLGGQPKVKVRLKFRSILWIQKVTAYKKLLFS